MRRFVLSVLVLSSVAIADVANAFAQPACDRTCLRTLLDQYLSAVIKHDPAAAPLVAGFRQTENAVNVRPGNGVWKTVTGLGGMQRRYLDAASSQAAYYGLVQEGADSAIVTVRIRVENRKLTEAEWYLARANDQGLNGPRQPGRPPANLFNPEYLTANPPPDRVVAAVQRLPREALLAITNSYFDAITSHDGSVALTHPGCGRVENGSPAPAGRFLPPLTSPATTTNDCVAGLQNFNASMVVARRIPLIDEEAQAVLGMAVFIRRPGSPTPRNVFSEWFFIDEGKIRTIYTAMFYPPPELAVPNWPPYEGNWPLPAGIVPSSASAPTGQAMNSLSAAERAQGWQLLFDGQTLTGWHVSVPVQAGGGRTGPAQAPQPGQVGTPTPCVVRGSESTPPGASHWEVVDGRVTACGAPTGYLTSDRSYKNFVLTIEFMCGADTNSGVFVRSPQENGGYEVQIWRQQPAGYNTGAIVGVAKTAREYAFAADRWNRYQITADADHLVVELNGETTLDVHDARFPEGHLRLQYQQFPVAFRNIKIRPLP